MKKILALFVFLFFFANTASACFETYPAINHAAKECGYYSSRTVCDGGIQALLKAIPQGDWKIPDKSSDFAKYCDSLGYTLYPYPEKIIPSKDVCCSLKTNHYIIILGIILLIVCVIILFRMYKKKK